MVRREDGGSHGIAEDAFGESGSTVGDMGRGARGDGWCGTGSGCGGGIGVGVWESFVFVVFYSFE